MSGMNSIQLLHLARSGSGVEVTFRDDPIGLAEGTEATAFLWLEVARNQLGRTPLLPHELQYLQSVAAFFARHKCPVPDEITREIDHSRDAQERAARAAH